MYIGVRGLRDRFQGVGSYEGCSNADPQINDRNPQGYRIRLTGLPLFLLTIHRILMNETAIYLILTGILSLITGFIIGKLWIQGRLGAKISGLTAEKRQMENQISKITGELSEKNRQHQSLLEQKQQLEISVAEKNSIINSLQDKQKALQEETSKIREQLNKEFENLANKIMEEKTEKFTRQNKENLQQILTPLNEKIKNFEEKIERTHKESIDYHAALRQQIRGLQELNRMITKETENLTKALKGDSKTQGNWGEMVLERILESSGLEKGREYEVEKSFASDEPGVSRRRPDIIIHLPGNRKMIIDSKVSLTHYEQWVSASDEQEKQNFLKLHLQSLHRHINQLSDKSYENIYKIESPDFVLMFIPIEPAFAIALQKEPDLYLKAFDKKIVIVTPTTLLATLRTIDSMWMNEKQQQNAMEIARQAGALYDKFVNLIDNLEKVGHKMNAAKQEYDTAMNRLATGNGNILGRIERLKKMGAKTKKALPEKWLSKSKDNPDE